MKELKVALFLLSSVILFIVGYINLCNLNVVQKKNNYYFYVSDVSNISKEASILLNGMPVGSVSKIDFSESTLLSKITISLNSKIKLNENSEIIIVGLDALYKKFELNLNDGQILRNNSEIKVIDNSIKAKDILKKVNNVLDNLEKVSANIAIISKNVDNGLTKIKDADIIGKLTEVTDRAVDLINNVKIPWLFKK